MMDYPTISAVGEGERLSALRPDSGTGVLRSFVERSGVCVAQLDRDMRIARANADFRRLLGSARPGAVGQDLCQQLHPDDRERVAAQLSRLVDDPSVCFTERVVVSPRGRRAVTGELTGLVVSGPSSRWDGVVVLVEPDGRLGEDRSAHGRLLTEVDARILEGIGAGVSTVQLAAMLYLSRGGVEYHVTTMLRRFKVKNRPALISRAYAMGIFRVGTWPPRVMPQFLR